MRLQLFRNSITCMDAELAYFFSVFNHTFLDYFHSCEMCSHTCLHPKRYWWIQLWYSWNEDRSKVWGLYIYPHKTLKSIASRMTNSEPISLTFRAVNIGIHSDRLDSMQCTEIWVRWADGYSERVKRLSQLRDLFTLSCTRRGINVSRQPSTKVRPNKELPRRLQRATSRRVILVYRTEARSSGLYSDWSPGRSLIQKMA